MKQSHELERLRFISLHGNGLDEFNAIAENNKMLSLKDIMLKSKNYQMESYLMRPKD